MSNSNEEFPRFNFKDYFLPNNLLNEQRKLKRRMKVEIDEGFLGITSPIVVIWNRDLEPNEWRLTNTPVLHLEAGDHIMEELRELKGDFKRSKLLEALQVSSK
jgi:hypothetical protein